MALGAKFGKFFGISEDQFDEDEDYQYEEQQASQVDTNKKVVSLDGKRRTMSEKKIALFEPRVYSDVKAIATRLLSDQAAVVNFQRMDEQQSKRIVDFLTGTIFAINGEIQRVGDQIFLCTPAGFVVEGNVTSEFTDSDFN
ncbi:cell division protein SepF [Liquorilactobacillus mali]|nr:cell division protein SepF [Liquorilactobacillus mali]MDN7144476.1 cell division protein SepF [Liquorilactobacillus mali]